MAFPASRMIDRNQMCAASVFIRGCQAIRYLNVPSAAGASTILSDGFEASNCAMRRGTVGADVAEVARAIVRVVDLPFGSRPFRIHIDPAQDGAEIVNGVADRVRAELLRNMGLADLLKPAG